MQTSSPHDIFRNTSHVFGEILATSHHYICDQLCSTPLQFFYTQTLALAAALALATSTPLTEGGRKTQRALYMEVTKMIY